MNKQLFNINIKSLLVSACLILGISTDIFAEAIVGGFDPIVFNIGDASGEFGDTVCVDVTVENFFRVETFQFSINYNTNIVSIVCPVDVSNSPLDQNELFFNCFSDDGTIPVLWGDPSVDGNGVTIPDGDIIFSLCFRITGTCGLSTPIDITSHPIEIEVQQISEEGVSCPSNIIEVNPGELDIICPEMRINAFKCDASSSNDDGTISFYIAGGSGDYDYEVNPIGITGNVGESEWVELTGLASGNYTITATDNVTGEVIDRNLFLSDIGGISVSLDATDPYCFNRDKGTIETNVTNSFGDIVSASMLDFEWSNFRFTEDIDDLGSGTYTVTVTDFSGCSATASATLFVEPLLLNIEVIDSASCEGNDDAIVKIWAEGGTPFPPNPNPGYEYESDAGDAGPIDTLFLNNVESGLFNFSVIDAAIPSCIVDSIIDIPFKGIDLAIDLDTTNISCFGANDGSVTVTAFGSTNFGFQVRDEFNNLVPGGGSPTEQTFENLSEGCYSVTVIEAFNGCEIRDTFCIEEPSEFILTVDAQNNPGCVGNDGSILLTSGGGTMPYEYEWSDGPSMDEDRTGLEGGTYTVTVTDDRGCSNTATFNLPDGTDVQIDANVIQAINCPQDENGIIEVIVSTGGNFTYNWETPGGTFVSDQQTVTDLGAGVYYVTATDASAMCTALDTVVLAPASPIIIEGNFTSPTCPGVPNGVIGIEHIIGTFPFTYLWEDQSSLQVLSGITEGTYNVTITDANSCELDTFLVLEVANPILVDFTDVVGVDCFGASNGSITATASGGPDMAGTYTYFWSNDPTNGQTGASSSQSGFPAGENWVIASDFFCISDTMFFTIPDIDSIVIDLANSTITDPSCFGDCDGSLEISAIGGNPNSYTYTWTDDNSNDPLRTDLCAGFYNVEIEDANGCTVIRSIELVEPEILAIDSFNTKGVGCNGSLGSINIQVIGGTMPYMYTWTNNVSDSNEADGLDAGSYDVIVTDANDCSVGASYVIEESQPVTAVIADIVEPDCFGGQTCISIESASGGSGSGYKFTITPDGFQFPLDSCVAVFAIDYDITVRDGTGECAWDTTIVIGQPDQITVDAGPDQEIDLGSTSDVISPIINSSLPINDIIWSPMDSLECLDSDCEEVVSNTLNDILYTVTVVDENGCSAFDDVLVTVNTSRNVYIPNIFTPNGDGTNDYFNLVIGSGAVSVSYLSIFDRWGNRVFAIENEYIPEVGMQDGWDGKYNGQFVNPGVYVYTAQVNFLDGRILQYSGDVTVIR